MKTTKGSQKERNYLGVMERKETNFETLKEIKTTLDTLTERATKRKKLPLSH